MRKFVKLGTKKAVWTRVKHQHVESAELC